jgi:DNA modification methylase
MEINKVYCMDALQFLKQLPDKFADLCLTDPPYGVGIKEWDKKVPLVWCDEISRVMADDASLLVFCGKQNRLEVEQRLRKAGLIFWQELIWYYRNGGIQRKRSYNGHHEPILWFVKNPGNFHFDTKNKLWIDNWTVIEKSRPQRNFKKDKKIHPTQKSLEVVKHLIENHSKEGDIVLDPFMGSGTTALAAQMTKRNFIGCDIIQKYVDITNRRLQNPWI